MAEAFYEVFVYGTLKKGQPNEYFMNLLPSVEYLGSAETCTKYPLIVRQDWNLPMLLNLEGKGKIVKGELYRVNDAALKQLDEFEGHPDFYERQQIVVKLVKDKEAISSVKCWTYFIKNYTDEDLKQDYFSLYDSGGSHGLAYDTRENEDHPTHS